MKTRLIYKLVKVLLVIIVVGLFSSFTSYQTNPINVSTNVTPEIPLIGSLARPQLRAIKQVNTNVAITKDNFIVVSY